MVTLRVFDPCGLVGATRLRHAPRLLELSGKTICELSDRIWEDYRTFPVIRKLLRERFPTSTIIPYTELPDEIDSDETANIIKEKGCDGVIVGNAA